MPRNRIISYNPKLKKRASALRQSGNWAEVLLWSKLKGRQMRGVRFLRQRPIDEYIVDFFCPELMLAIEIDGGSHNEKAEQDNFRQTRLESLGIRFLRFTDHDVRQNLFAVLQRIEAWIDETTGTPD